MRSADANAAAGKEAAAESTGRESRGIVARVEHEGGQRLEGVSSGGCRPEALVVNRNSNACRGPRAVDQRALGWYRNSTETLRLSTLRKSSEKQKPVAW